jgi:hypothetical protein
MARAVRIDLGRQCDVKARAAQVLEMLSGVPTSASHFSKLEKLTDLGDGVYQRAMQKVRASQVNIQTIYAREYVSDKAKGTAKWSPVKGLGGALAGGSWILAHNKTSTSTTLAMQGDFEVPLPGLMKMPVAPVVKSQV